MTYRKCSMIAVLGALMTCVAGWSAVCAAETAGQPVLKNAGFEDFNKDAGLPAAFSKAVYGEQPTIAADDSVFSEGKRSVRVSASKPSDTALAQDAVVKPNGIYRFSGSVKTESLVVEESSSTHGTYQIQDSAGGTIGVMNNHRGTTDWVRESVVFRAPADGKVHIACFFVGFGKGTGTVWFDDLKLEEVAVGDALAVTPRKLRKEPVSPLIYGNFVEMLSDLIPSMWAEMLDVTSFEFLRTPQERALRKSNFVHDPMRDPRDRFWRPLGDPAFASVDLDADNPFNGTVSQKITLKDGGKDAGIRQDGIAVRQGEEYRFVGHFRARDFAGPVIAEIRDRDAVLGSATIEGLTADWQRKEVVLKAEGSADYAQFVIRMASPGTLWIDRVSLMPVKNVGGWRVDVVEALKAMKPGLIRWGGSAIEGYDWKAQAGPWEKRVPFANRYWGRIDPNFVGLDEFIGLCHAVEAEPLVCIRWSGQKPSDAADLVEYCNGGAETPMGAVRAKNGHAAPYRVKYFQIGNEVGGDAYAASVADFARAMKKADPSIRILVCYISEKILKNAGDLIDYTSPHPYDVGSVGAPAAQFDHYRELLSRLAPDRKIGVAATEWNTTAGEWGGIERTRQMSLGNAIACGRFLNLCQRNSDLVKIACRSNISNSYCSGIIQTNNHMVVKTPAYHALKLYAEHAGKWPLALSDNAALLPIDVSATLSDDGRTLTLNMVNPQTEPVAQAFDLSAFGKVEARAKVWTLADIAEARDPDVLNTFDRPDRIVVDESEFGHASKRFSYSVPAVSVVLMELTVEASPAE